MKAYKCAVIKPQDLVRMNKIAIPNQSEIEAKTGSELNPTQTWQLIKQASDDFTKEDAAARECDELLYLFLDKNSFFGDSVPEPKPKTEPAPKSEPKPKTEPAPKPKPKEEPKEEPKDVVTPDYAARANVFARLASKATGEQKEKYQARANVFARLAKKSK